MREKIEISTELADIGKALKKPVPKAKVPVSADDAKKDALKGSHLRLGKPLFNQGELPAKK